MSRMNGKKTHTHTVPADSRQLLIESTMMKFYLCIPGSGIINHPLRDEPGLKTKKANHHSSEYSSPATHVRQGSWGNVCVTRCMCEYSREHSCVYVVGIIHSTGKGY